MHRMRLFVVTTGLFGLFVSVQSCPTSESISMTSLQTNQPIHQTLMFTRTWLIRKLRRQRKPSTTLQELQMLTSRRLKMRRISWLNNKWYTPEQNHQISWIDQFYVLKDLLVSEYSGNVFKMYEALLEPFLWRKVFSGMCVWQWEKRGYCWFDWYKP